MSNNGFYDIQYKANAGQVNLDQAQGIVECFVAGIGNKDSVGDVCASGAFTKSLMRRKPRVVWGHNWNDPIGKVLEIYEVPPNDPRLPGKMKAAGIGGLYARVQFNLNSEKGREAFANVAFFGEEQEWSIGYKTIKAQFDQQNQANILYEVELYEVSPVLHGANQLTGTISVKNAEKGGTAVMPMPASPVEMPEEDIQRKLQEQLSAQLGGKVKVSAVSDNHVMFTREGDEENMYKCRFHHEDGAFMFGQPQRIVMPMAMPQAPKPQQMPQMPMGMPSKPIQPAATGQTVIVPAALPGGNPQQQPLVRISYSEDGSPKKPEGKPKLVQEEADLADALIKITKRHGKFNEDSTGVWAGYKSAAENPVAKIGVKCSNCVMYEGNGSCKIIDKKVEDGGKCRFAIIPEGVVQVTPIKKQELAEEKEKEEVKWLSDIEAKFPEEFLNGDLRMALKRKREAQSQFIKMVPINKFESKSLESNTYFYVPVATEHAFEVKQAIDPIIDFYRADAYVEDGGIVFTSGVNKDFAEAIDTAVKALGRNLRGAISRGGRGLSARFNPNAWDGDNDGIVQEGTPFQRPAIPGVNDFSTRGKVNKRKARQAWEQYQREGKPKVQKKPSSQAPRPSAPKPARGEDLTPSAPRPGAGSGRKRSLTRHSNRDPKFETQMPDRAENAKRESHEALIQAWEQGMGMPFTPIERQVGEKGPRFTEDWLRGRELGYNDAKARWMGKGTSKRPSTFKEDQKSSVDYANWFMNVVGQLGMDKRDRDRRGAQSNYDNEGIDAGIKTFLMENAPTPQSDELQKRINDTLKDAGFERGKGLSSGGENRTPPDKFPSLTEMRKRTIERNIKKQQQDRANQARAREMEKLDYEEFRGLANEIDKRFNELNGSQSGVLGVAYSSTPNRDRIRNFIRETKKTGDVFEPLSRNLEDLQAGGDRRRTALKRIFRVTDDEKLVDALRRSHADYAADQFNVDDGETRWDEDKFEDWSAYLSEGDPFYFDVRKAVADELGVDDSEQDNQEVLDAILDMSPEEYSDYIPEERLVGVEGNDRANRIKRRLDAYSVAQELGLDDDSEASIRDAAKRIGLSPKERADLERRRDNEEQSARDMDRGLSSGARYGDRYDPSRRKPDDYAQINGEPHRPRWDGKQGKWVYDVADDGTSATRVHDWDTPETPAEDHDAFWRSWVRIPYQELLSEYPPVAGEKSPILSRRLRNLVASQSSPYNEGRGGAPFGGKFTRKINRYLDATDPSYAPKLTSEDESYAQAVAETIAKDFSHSDLTIDELAYRFDATPLQIHDILDSVAKEAPETFDGNRKIGDIPKPSREVEKLRKDRLDLAQEYDTAIKTNRDLASKRAQLFSDHPSKKRADNLEKLSKIKDALRSNGSSRETAEKDLQELRSEDINVAKAKSKEMMGVEDDESIIQDGKDNLLDVEFGLDYDRDYGDYDDYVAEEERQLIADYDEKYGLTQKLIDSGQAEDEDEAREFMEDIGLEGVVDLIDDDELIRVSTDWHAQRVQNGLNSLRQIESRFDSADPALSDNAKNNRNEASRLKTEAQNAVNALFQDVDVPKRAGTSSIRGLSSGRRETNADMADVGNAAGYIYNASGVSSGRRSGERGIDYRQGDPATVGRDMERLSQRSDDLGANYRYLRELDSQDSAKFMYGGRMREIWAEDGSRFSRSMKVSKDGAVYFVGFDPDAEGYRSFRLDKIEGLIQGADYEGYSAGWTPEGFTDPLPRALSGLSSGRNLRPIEPFDEIDNETYDEYIKRAVDQLNEDGAIPPGILSGDDGTVYEYDPVTRLAEDMYYADQEESRQDYLGSVGEDRSRGLSSGRYNWDDIDEVLDQRFMVGVLKRISQNTNPRDSEDRKNVREMVSEFFPEDYAKSLSGKSAIGKITTILMSEKPEDQELRKKLFSIFSPSRAEGLSISYTDKNGKKTYRSIFSANEDGLLVGGIFVKDEELMLLAIDGESNDFRTFKLSQMEIRRGRGLRGESNEDGVIRDTRESSETFYGRTAKERQRSGLSSGATVDKARNQALADRGLRELFKDSNDYDAEFSYWVDSLPERKRRNATEEQWERTTAYADALLSYENRLGDQADRIADRRTSGLSSGSSKIDINDEGTIVDAVRNTINGDKPKLSFRDVRSQREYMSDEAIGLERLDILKRAIQTRNEILSAYGIRVRPGSTGLEEINIDNLDERTVNAIDELDDFINAAVGDFQDNYNSLEERKSELSKYVIERDDAETAIRKVKEEKITLENDFNDRDLDEDGDLIISPEYFEAKMQELDDEEESLGDDLRRLNSYIEDAESDIKDFGILGNLVDDAETAYSSNELTPREQRRQGLSSGRRDLTDDDIEARNEYMREGMLDQVEREEDDFIRSFRREPMRDQAKIAVAYRRETGRSANPKDSRFRKFAEEMIAARDRSEEDRFDTARDQERGLSSGARSFGKIGKVADQMFDEYVTRGRIDASTEELADKYGVSDLVAERARRQAQEYIDEVTDYFRSLPDPTDEELQAMADDYERRGLSSGRDDRLPAMPFEMSDWLDLSDEEIQDWMDENELGVGDEDYARELWEDRELKLKNDMTDSMLEELEELAKETGEYPYYIEETIKNHLSADIADYARARRDIDSEKRYLNSKGTGLSSGRNRKKG